MLTKHVTLLLGIIFVQNVATVFSLEIIYALNAGGEAYTDSLGIRYRRDFLTEGVASDYGKSLDIKRVALQDKILYQTERYATETFGYTIPMPSGDGDYVLWLKFCEVWFNAPNLKVFDVALNDMIVVKDLDIFSKVGRGVAHDEYVAFQIRQNKILINGKTAPFSNEIKVDFVKTDHDNPKVNALLIMKGKLDQVPQLPPYTPPEPKNEEFEDADDDYSASKHQNDENLDQDEDDFNERRKPILNENNEDNSNKFKKKQPKKSKIIEPKVSDPYEADETSYLIPILVAFGAFIPLLFCLCKL